MATTPNYSWVMPDPTDFVTDLPADFETFGDAVDASLYALSPGTTAGDLDYYTSSTAKARLGIGTAGQILAVNSGATAPEWIAAPSGGSFEDYTLLNAGGTALTGATSITVSGITDINKLLIGVELASSVNASAFMSLRINGDTASNYRFFGSTIIAASAYASSSFMPSVNLTGTSFPLGRMSTGVNSELSASIAINGGRSTGGKQVQIMTGTSGAGSSGMQFEHTQGLYVASAAITSITIISSTGNFDNGSIYVYGSSL